MFLRELTDEEIEKIKKYKDSANKVIKVQRKKLAEEIKVNQKAYHIHNAELLAKQLEAHTVITGRPVIVKVGYDVVTLNHDLLKKYERSLDKGNFHSQWVKIEGKYLIIRYEKHGQSGTLELLELPAHQVDLLDGLPIVDLKG